MSYRGPNTQRLNAQATETVLQHAGQTAVWRSYVSASAGNPDAGYGSKLYYREQTITAIFGQKPNMPMLAQGQTYGGQITHGELMVTTTAKIGLQDELIWRGETYRVESDPVPARMVGLWVSMVKRGEG